MANIGQPERRFTVVPLGAPVTAPEGPNRDTPIPEKEPAAPMPVEKELV